jgi:hypothetical protein
MRAGGVVPRTLTVEAKALLGAGQPELALPLLEEAGGHDGADAAEARILAAELSPARRIAG